MSEGGAKPQLTVVGGQGKRTIDQLRAEIEALQYENQKLRTIQDVLVKRVELGWGNFSTAYSSFEKAAMLTEQVESKSRALQKTRSRLQAAEFDLNRTEVERDTFQTRLTEVIETIPDAVALFDNERVLVHANASFYEFWSGTGAEIIPGQTRLVELGRLAVTHGLFDRSSRSAERATAGSKADTSLFRMADGRWLQMSERETADGGLVVVYNDVTAVKQGEQSERERADRAYDSLLENMLENLPQGVVLVDHRGGLRASNLRFRQLVQLETRFAYRGFPVAEILANSAIGEAVGDIDTIWCDCDPTTSGCQREINLRCGTVIEMKSHPLMDGGMVLTFNDITARSRDAQALREAAQRLRLMTDALPALIAFVSREEVYEFANRTFEEWYERPREQIEGAPLVELLGDEELGNHRRHIDRALAGQSVSFEVEQALPDGQQRIFSKSYIPDRNDDNEVAGFFVLEQDVTEQRRTASALKHAYRHMEQRVFERTRELSQLNDKLQAEVEERAQVERHLLEATREARQASESKVKFMAAAGHDLLQPLNAARLFTAAMLDEQLPGRAQSLAGSLSRSLDDVESIITTLVDISKLEAGVVEAAPDAFPVDNLLSALADEFSVLVGEAGLDFHYVRSGAVVFSDSQLLARILRNLLTNALRYTDFGRIVLGCRRRTDCLEIAVADTGIGIEPEELQRIFGEFQRAEAGRNRDERGLGLGLAIVDKLSNVLGCSISVRSLPNQGSMFTVSVPYGQLSEAPEPVEPTTSVMAELNPQEGKHVLVVDNDVAILEGMRTLLSNWGCVVATAKGIEEMAVLLNAGFVPDLAMLDYQLDGDEDGFQAAQVLRAKTESPCGVIMITANYSKDLKLAAGDSDITLLNKPVKPLKLRNVMTRLAGK